MSVPNFSKPLCTWPLHPGSTSCSEPSFLYWPLLMLVVILTCGLSVVSVMGNALWIAAYAKTPALQTPLNMCLLSLASVGLFNGVVMQPLIISDAIFFLVCPSITCSLEHIVTGIVTLVADSTLQNIAVISIDRYIAILKGARYLQLVTKKRIVIAFGTYALFRVFLSVCVFTGMIDYLALVIVSVVFSSVIVLFTCVRIIFRIRRLRSVVVGPNPSPEEERRRVHERKITKTFGVLVAMFILCFAPAMGYYFVLESIVVDPVLRAIVWRFIEVIMMLNAVLNFAVYFWRHGEKRVAVRKVISDAYAAIKGCNCH
ncbi:beta-3 adrenergic receptor-like [Stylophora pistillata]|uniref:beta-3 adrenergic receptor-like n=1 Tax=Stylophora pistillata TaxID=50429 RepID=UPI000C03D658|nr:beta-3 adrenergic receptor-like [Stylophora pistillata]